VVELLQCLGCGFDATSDRVGLGLRMVGPTDPRDGCRASLGQLVLLSVQPCFELGQLAAAALGLATSLFAVRDGIGELARADAKADLRLFELLGEAGRREVTRLELGPNLLEPA